MSRSVALILILLALIIGALFLLSGNATEVPTRTIETDVTAATNAN